MNIIELSTFEDILPEDLSHEAHNSFKRLASAVASAGLTATRFDWNVETLMEAAAEVIEARNRARDAQRNNPS